MSFWRVVFLNPLELPATSAYICNVTIFAFLFKELFIMHRKQALYLNIHFGKIEK